MFTRQGLRQSWEGTRPYFIFSVILFFAGVVVGGSTSSPTEWLDQQLVGIKEIAETVNESSTPQLTMFMLIVKNNIYASIMAMGIGVVGGIMPIFMLILNGMVLGHMFDGLGDAGQNVWLLLVKGILPHGILELSAVFLACAVGIRFGLTFIKGVWGSLLGKSKSWHSFVQTAVSAVPAIILVIGLLVIAAVVESTISYWLMS
jgi:stage II sporulation protein M